MQDCVLPKFGVLTSEQIRQINENSFLINYRKGQLICHQGHPISHVLFLKSGLVKIFTQYQQDKSSIIGVVSDNSFFGILSVFDGKLYQNGTSALEDSEVIHTRLDVFMNVLSENGEYAICLLRQVCKFGLLIIDKIVKSSYKQVPGKLAEVLLLFSKEFYKSETFELPMSRQEIADFISASKETVSRTLSEFKNDRIIDINDKFITLKSIDLLERLSKIG